LVPQIKVWTEFIISTLSSKERSGDPFKSTSMIRKSAKSLVSSKDVYQSCDFSRKSLSKYLMDTIDFNKYDIGHFINLTKIVRYGRH
jgi:hypothetical protein